MYDRLHLLDQHFQADTVRQAQALLDLRQEPIDPPDILRRFHLGHDDNIDVLARLLHDGDDVLVGVLRLQVVNAVGARLLAPVQRFECVDHLRPRRTFSLGETESSRSRNTRSALLATAFSIIRSLLAGVDNSDRLRRIYFPLSKIWTHLGTRIRRSACCSINNLNARAVAERFLSFRCTSRHCLIIGNPSTSRITRRLVSSSISSATREMRAMPSLAATPCLIALLFPTCMLTCSGTPAS